MEKSKSKMKIHSRRLKVYEIYLDCVGKNMISSAVKKLASRFGVTEVTIYNDIKRMKNI